MHNVNPTTGIRYGVISFNSLQPWCSEDLFYGQNARDLSYEEALEDLKREAVTLHESLTEQACEAFVNEPAGAVFEDFAEAFFEKHGHEFERDDFVSDFVQRQAEHIQIEEPVYEGEYDRVKYRISWLGGAPLLWVLEGPIGYVNQLCSPCVPNAGDLDSGFITGQGQGSSYDHAKTLEQGFRCYVVPQTWLADVQEV